MSDRTEGVALTGEQLVGIDTSRRYARRLVGIPFAISAIDRGLHAVVIVNYSLASLST